MKRWVTFFSQTGKEIADISEKTGRYPDLIICNNLLGKNIDRRLEEKVLFIEKMPSKETYFNLLKEEDLITLHGYLRVIPPEVCNLFEIYNGHPGLISEFPGLKGKDPQKKALDLNLDYSGCVIHRVTEGVDEGEIICTKKVFIKGFNLEKTIFILKETSLELWLDFLSERL